VARICAGLSALWPSIARYLGLPTPAGKFARWGPRFRPRLVCRGPSALGHRSDAPIRARLREPEFGSITIIKFWVYLECQLFSGILTFGLCGLGVFCGFWGVDKISEALCRGAGGRVIRVDECIGLFSPVEFHIGSVPRCFTFRRLAVRSGSPGTEVGDIRLNTEANDLASMRRAYNCRILRAT
jgi:hypothetical protein